MVTIEGRLRDSGWALVMPESEEAAQNPLTNMLKWVTGEVAYYSADRRLPRHFQALRPTGKVQLGRAQPPVALLCLSQGCRT